LVDFSVPTVEPTPAPTPTPRTAYERKGGVVTLDWSKCCDCEAAPIRPRGTPCEVSLVEGDRLVLRWDSRLKQGVPKRHNIFSVPDEAAFDECLLGDAVEVGGGDDGVASLDVSLSFPSAGTFFYVCKRMCEPLTDFCHCSAFTHKLRVEVLPDPYIRPGYTGQVAVTSLAVDLGLFEVDLEGDLDALGETEAVAVRAFASGVARDVEAAVGESTGVSATVTCLYRLSDASRVDLLTLKAGWTMECVAPRRLEGGGRALQAAAQGFGVIMVFREPVAEVSLEEVVISRPTSPTSSRVSVRAEATTVLASPGSDEDRFPDQDRLPERDRVPDRDRVPGPLQDLPDFQANAGTAPPEDAIVSSGLAAVTASGMLMQRIF
jgi:hypothetical protein